MKICYKFILVFYIAFSSSGYAEENITKDYTRAYNYCSPIARQKTIEKCNYGKMVEKSYLDCMYKGGYREDDDMSKEGYYKAYMESHKKCNLSANYAAKEECNYGKVYQVQYNICMLEIGFNADGDKIASPKPNNSPVTNDYKDDPSDYQDAKKDNRFWLGKLFDSIFP